jgi:hypothetical protein
VRHSLNGPMIPVHHHPKYARRNVAITHNGTDAVRSDSCSTLCLCGALTRQASASDHKVIYSDDNAVWTHMQERPLSHRNRMFLRLKTEKKQHSARAERMRRSALQSASQKHTDRQGLWLLQPQFHQMRPFIDLWVSWSL